MMKRHIFLNLVVIFLFLSSFMIAYAGDVDPKLKKGWEVGSEYNSHYDVREYEKIRAWFIRAKE
ncbi:MAG: hypothetical protein PVI00_06660, partial [Desulfobacterales bacterium]